MTGTGGPAAGTATPDRGLPGWLVPLATAASSVTVADLTDVEPPAEGGRESAVLVLFGEGPRGPDVLLLERSEHLRSHAGQVAFPGGAADAEDAGPVATALREAAEETGLDPSGVVVFGRLPRMWLPPSGFHVTPVLGWWADPSDVRAADAGEVAAVARVPLAELVAAENRFRVRHPSGYVGPAFAAADLLVWGFTAGVLDRLLSLGRLDRPWDPTRFRALPPDLAGGPAAAVPEARSLPAGS